MVRQDFFEKETLRQRPKNEEVLPWRRRQKEQQWDFVVEYSKQRQMGFKNLGNVVISIVVWNLCSLVAVFSEQGSEKLKPIWERVTGMLKDLDIHVAQSEVLQLEEKIIKAEHQSFTLVFVKLELQGLQKVTSGPMCGSDKDDFQIQFMETEVLTIQTGTFIL